jgi:DNA-binding beta-propeller fold protein YncE
MSFILLDRFGFILLKQVCILVNGVVNIQKVEEKYLAMILMSIMFLPFCTNAQPTLSSVKTNSTNSISSFVVSKINAASFPIDVAVNPNTDIVYVLNTFPNSTSEISVLDGKTNKVLDNIALNQLAIAMAGEKIIYALNGEKNIPTNGHPSNQIVQPTAPGIKVGQSLSGIAVNPVTNRIYLLTSNSTYVVDGNTKGIVANISLVHGQFNSSIPVHSRDIAVNPKTNKIYVLYDEVTKNERCWTIIYCGYHLG